MVSNVMTTDQFALLQNSLIYVFGPLISWWLVGLVMLSVTVSVYVMFLGLLRWMSRQKT